MKSLRFILLTLCLCAAACDRAPKGQPAATTDGGRVVWVDPKTIQPGPIRRDTLTDEQMTRIRTLHEVFAEVEGQTIEKWVDDFKRDADPDKELRVWERMAKAYRGYCDGKKLALEAKKDVFRIVLLRSMASEQDVLDRIELKRLTRDDAIAVMKGF